MEPRPPTVFVTQDNQKLDYEPAREFGEIEYLTFIEYSPHPNDGVGNAEFMNQLWDKLQLYEPGIDYILASGSPISIFVTGLIVGNFPHSATERHKILKWNHRLRDYELCIVPGHALIEQETEHELQESSGTIHRDPR